MRKELVNARLRLDDAGFDKEIGIMEQYIKILGKDLSMKDEETAQISRDNEIASPAPQRSLEENLANLFHEILLQMQAKPGGAIAVSGFTMKRKAQPEIVTLLNERGLFEMTKIEHLQVVERDRLDAVMKEQKLSLSDLMDTANAISVGKVLSARFILTGSVIVMPSSVVIFARIVNVETAEVESAAQVIVPKSPEVSSLL
jgi:TolB-like protein